MGDVLKAVAPIAGTLIAGPAGGAIGGLLGGAASNAFGSGKGVGGILEPAAMGLGGGLLGGMSLPGGGTVSQKVGQAFMDPSGSLDLGKVLSATGAVSGLVGQQQQRQSAQDYANAQIAQRNALMKNIMGPQNYGLSPKLAAPNLNQQSSATPAGGSGTTGGNY